MTSEGGPGSAGNPLASARKGDGAPDPAREGTHSRSAPEPGPARPDLLAHRIEGGHWLTFDDERHITGCHCGFAADPDDMGYGDSVLDHFERVVRAEHHAT